jgi:hypothetical protein
LHILGGFEESLSSFLDLVRRWFDLPSRPSIQRVALGAVLLQPVESRQAGYRRIAEYLPAVQIDPEGSSDFLYQINRPTKSAIIPGQALNRLSKWYVAAFTPFRIQMQLPPPQAQLLPGMLLAGPGIFTCRVEMDLSTSQSYTGELPPDQVAQVYNEMVELAKDIANKGDRP